MSRRARASTPTQPHGPSSCWTRPGVGLRGLLARAALVAILLLFATSARDAFAAAPEPAGLSESGGSGASPEADRLAAAPAAVELNFQDRLLLPFNEWLTTQLYAYGTDGDVTQWGAAIGFGLGLLLLAWLFATLIDQVLYARLRRWAERTTTQHDDKLIDAVRTPTRWLILVTGIWLTTYAWSFPIHRGDSLDILYNFVARGYFVALWILVGVFLMKFSGFVAGLLSDVANKTDSPFDDHLIQPINKTLNAAAFIFTAIMIIQTLGGSIAGILAGLGLGGLAFALAGQETVSNLFGSAMIFADKPFRVGETVSFDGVTGTVESIGFRTTVIRTFEKTEYRVPNKDLAGKMVENITRRTHRRFRTTFGTTYGAKREQITGLINAIRAELAGRDEIDADSVYVYFTGFGASQLDILVSANINDINYAVYLGAVQEINLRIWELYDEYGLEMAFPTQTIENKPTADWADVIAAAARQLGLAPEPAPAPTKRGKAATKAKGPNAEDEAGEDDARKAEISSRKRAAAEKRGAKLAEKAEKSDATLLDHSQEDLD